MNNKIKYLGIVFLLAVAIIIGIITSKDQAILSKKDTIYLDENLNSNDNSVYNIGSIEKSEIVEDISEPIEICVFVCGEVLNVGVYSLPAGSRVIDAVEAAGGFTDSAAREYTNLAGFITDGAKIYIPNKEETERGELDISIKSMSIESVENSSNSALINLNSATKEQLMSLPGVGESKAEAIIKYRESSGKFHSIEDIMNISGIKEGLFNKIKDRITV